MTPKEKARELVDKMMLYSYEKIENEKNTKYIVDNKIKKEYAIQCALIAVNEILIIMNEEYLSGALKIEYWQEVKQEIKK
jgi:hypothetical protein